MPSCNFFRIDYKWKTRLVVDRDIGIGDFGIRNYGLGVTQCDQLGKSHPLKLFKSVFENVLFEHGDLGLLIGTGDLDLGL